jgi:hypothetical protein
VFWVGIYQMGKAGEIIFYHPDYKLPCYRCITETRYRFFDKNRLADHLRGDFRGSGKSSGLPSAASFIDAVLDHLVIGLVHMDIDENQHGRLFKKILNEKRNFIQCQLDPDYKLNDQEDIFSQIRGPDLIAFNTLFQRVNKKSDCIDCCSFFDSVWNHTDYTSENYRETIMNLCLMVSPYCNGPTFVHPLLKEYADLFPVWAQIASQQIGSECD